MSRLIQPLFLLSWLLRCSKAIGKRLHGLGKCLALIPLGTAIEDGELQHSSKVYLEGVERGALVVVGWVQHLGFEHNQEFALA